MADRSCTLSFELLLFPLIFLILIFSSVNYKSHFFPDSPNSNHRNILQEESILSESNKDTGIIEEKSHYFDREEDGLSRARAAILRASRFHIYMSTENESFVPRGSIYINSYAFHQSNIEMKKRFRVWTYKEGEPPLFHQGPMNGIYSTEGQLIDELDSTKGPFLARHPEEALAYFIPVSIANTIQFAYDPPAYSHSGYRNLVKDYIHIISSRYPYWNRSCGADHFFVSCHEWGPDATAWDPVLYKNFIRLLCNANSSQGFQPVRDVSFPKINLSYKPPRLAANNNRSILAFFAGPAHGYIREQLFSYWKDKDEDVQVHESNTLINYTQLLEQTMFCLCPSGYEVATPTVVESIYAGCIPVIISDHYVLPFSDVLDWNQFSIHIPVARIPEIKTILQGISMDDYLEKQKNLVQVQRHFVLNRPAEPYDIMHMAMHSLWLRRLNLGLPRL